MTSVSVGHFIGTPTQPQNTVYFLHQLGTVTHHPDVVLQFSLSALVLLKLLTELAVVGLKSGQIHTKTKTAMLSHGRYRFYLCPLTEPAHSAYQMKKIHLYIPELYIIHLYITCRYRLHLSTSLKTHSIHLHLFELHKMYLPSME